MSQLALAQDHSFGVERQPGCDDPALACASKRRWAAWGWQQDLGTPAKFLGSMQRLSAKMLRQMSYANPMQSLHALAGLNLVEEDGFGLRPNIGMRGSGTDRSARVTLMEDGVLMVPAPFTPHPPRTTSPRWPAWKVEVRKGGSQIAFGPQTAGGALNMVSTSIPDEELAGRVRMETGSFGNQQTHTAVGANRAHGATASSGCSLPATVSRCSMEVGTRGFDKADRVAKLQWSSANGRHVLRGKAMSSEEESRETYLGLAQADFDVSPMRRYAASAQDLMTTAHSHTVVGHEFKPTDDLALTTEVFKPVLPGIGTSWTGPWTRWAKKCRWAAYLRAITKTSWAARGRHSRGGRLGCEGQQLRVRVPWRPAPGPAQLGRGKAAPPDLRLRAHEISRTDTSGVTATRWRTATWC